MNNPNNDKQLSLWSDEIPAFSQKEQSQVDLLTARADSALMKIKEHIRIEREQLIFVEKTLTDIIINLEQNGKN